MDAINKAMNAIYVVCAIAAVVFVLVGTGTLPEGFYITDIITNNSEVQNIERQLNQSPSDWFN